LPHVRRLSAPGVTEIDVICMPFTQFSGYLLDSPADMKRLVQHERNLAQQAAARVADMLRAAGFKAVAIVGSGNPERGIVEHAKACGADLIAMSTHGRDGAGRWLLGSVADRVLHDAPAPVLLVRPETKEA
jgi:nucleotide-binding universal stress UspA family protein